MLQGVDCVGLVMDSIKGMEKPRFDYMTSSPDRYAILKRFARENRMNMTYAETLLWESLRGLLRTFRFRRQHIIGDFIVDFACIEQKLIIETDGGCHSEPRNRMMTDSGAKVS